MSYDKLFKLKNDHPNIEETFEYDLLEIFGDYTGHQIYWLQGFGVDKLTLFFKGHWNRHHLNTVQSVLDEYDWSKTGAINSKYNCGLIAMETDPTTLSFQLIKPLLFKGAHGGVLVYNERLFYADTWKQTVQEIVSSEKNQSIFYRFKELCLNFFKLLPEKRYSSEFKTNFPKDLELLTGHGQKELDKEKRYTTRGFLIRLKEKLIASGKPINPDGSLSRRIKFVQSKLGLSESPIINISEINDEIKQKMENVSAMK
ncbi:DUF5617 domain-containing protein [Legionella waltersii]|uniref:Uncharacterized protein n=1 Tax=Legionella waltersii TaxID=66969 RepID=A0A0W1ALE0_9GAMM|nr:DUF5617 domain-containing protein [Legionella waltersii]KTD82173.1 hypothetical protein Lwal_0650 [Legionella waltersii]SNV10488.1 Uncharacterised protein [Legionella waltersii]